MPSEGVEQAMNTGDGECVARDWRLVLRREAVSGGQWPAMRGPC